MNNTVKRATVGRVSPRGVTRQASDVDATGCAEDVGLRCANPTYGAETLWDTLSLKAAGVTLIDCDHRTPQAVEAGYPYIAIPQLKDGHISLDGVRRISESDYADWTKKLTPQVNDVIVVRRCNSGQSAHVPAGLKCAIGQNLVVLRADGTKVLPEYLRWLVRSAEWWAEVEKYINVGAVFDSLRCRDIPNFELPIPPLKEQRGISEVIAALDDRIALLRETNATLEAIAQALFKSWFVDFDPVRAKMEGRAPEGMDEATAALFSDGFEESELGLVPKGWRVERLNQLCNITSGKRPGERSDISTLSTHIPLFGGAGVMGFTNEVLFDSKRVLTGRVGTLGKVHIAYPPFWASDNVLVLLPNEEQLFHYCFHWLCSIDVHALNRGSTQPLLTQRDLGNQIHVIPTPNVLSAFASLVSPLYVKLQENTLQAQTLTTLRDTLLPRLISGQLRLPDLDAEPQPLELAA